MTSKVSEQVSAKLFQFHSSGIFAEKSNVIFAFFDCIYLRLRLGFVTWKYLQVK